MESSICWAEGLGRSAGKYLMGRYLYVYLSTFRNLPRRDFGRDGIEIKHQSRAVAQVLASGGPRPSACFGRDAIAACFAHGVFEIAQLWMTAATVVHQKPDQCAHGVNIGVIDDRASIAYTTH